MRLSTAHAVPMLRCARQHFGANTDVLLFMTTGSLAAECEHLANLSEAIQRRVQTLLASSPKIGLPLNGVRVEQRQEDTALFEAPASLNERQIQTMLIRALSRLPALCTQGLSIVPTTADFGTEFRRVCATITTSQP